MVMQRRWQWGNATFIALFASGIVLASALGGVFNLINGLVSPLYFITIMGWSGASDVWRDSIQQGEFEGLVSGVILSAIFSFGLASISQRRCPFDVGLRFLISVFASISLCWILGGLLAIFLAFQFPQSYHALFIGVPDNRSEMIRYAWVGGSIWGAYIGSVLSVIVALSLFGKRWKNAFAATEYHKVLNSSATGALLHESEGI